ncbi:hypothetical protein LXA43DRAFT_906396, partial [Ganoderma leucocontextum]
MPLTVSNVDEELHRILLTHTPPCGLLDQIYGRVSASGAPLQTYVAGHSDGAAQAGSAVYFGPGHSANSAWRTPGVQSTARAALFAVLRAVLAAPPASLLRIYTTVDYLPRAICHWAEQNARLRWKVENGDLLLALAWLIRARTGPVALYLVDDTANPWLQAADSLARTGS